MGKTTTWEEWKFFNLLLQFESCIKSVSYFNLFTAQVGYIKFRCEPEKEEKDALIRSTPRPITQIKKNHFDINSLLTRPEYMSNTISNERNRIIHLLETKL